MRCSRESQTWWPSDWSELVRAERVKIEFDEEQIRRLIDALDHYEAYLHSQQRDEMKFRELLVRLRKMLGTRGRAE